MTKLLVALDGLQPIEAIDAAAKIKPYCHGVKLGDILVDEGSHMIRHMKNQGYFVMVDNKWWDIPRTVANKVRRENEAGADIITVSLHCDEEALEGARQAAKHAKLVGVTVLTSSKQWLSGEPKDAHLMMLQFTKLARKAVEAGLDGITCPAPLLSLMAKLPKELFALTPGVRMPGDDTNDQKMVAAEPPKEAKYAVVGSPIVRAVDSVTAAKRYRDWLGDE